ncbi:MAG TPA: C40 family peptidase [Leadbetterella sp.]|nr:C40 family peptidase [Leadbetterella sp.]
MKNLLCILALTLFFVSCKKRTVSSSHHINKILVNKCQDYIGTPYKFGGTTKAGMDCSGLIFTAFKEIGEDIPRVSYKQAEHFEEVAKDEIKMGDLVYFKVNSDRINHTGIISRIENREEIYFLHASTSAGVREDNLLSKYWKSKFVKVTRPQI